MFSSDELAEITRVAACGYTPKQVAFIMGASPAAFVAMVMDEETEISIAYFKGLFSSELGVRESIMKMARNASSPAQTAALKIFDETKRELTKGDFPGFAQD